MKESTGKVSLFQRSPSVEQDNRWKNGSWLQAKRFLLFFVLLLLRLPHILLYPRCVRGAHL